MTRRGDHRWRRTIGAALIMALASVLLAGCYVSTNLYLDPSESEAPLVTGVYSRPTARGDEIKRVTHEPDGWYLVEIVDQDGTIGDSYRVLFNKMEMDGDRQGYIFASLDRDQDYFYGVMIVDHDGIHLGQPDCADEDDRNLAEDAGADFDQDTSRPSCRFHDADSLKQALATFADQTDFGTPFHLRP
jgi:hypothetical protein